MRYFFIDLENVRNEGLEGVLSLTDQDMVYIFYSENAFSMAIPTLESITNSKCTSKFIKTNYIGKNAMDFQIVSLFGATIERSKEGSFYIISKDNGFRSAVSFCESFFSDYSIKCGVYPRIITAINSGLEKEKTVKNKNSAKEGNADAKKNKAGTDKNAEEKKKNTVTRKNAEPEKNDTALVNAEAQPGSSEPESTEKTSGRHRRRNKNRSSDKVSQQTQAVEEDVANEQASDPGQKQAGENAQTAEYENIPTGRNVAVTAETSEPKGNKYAYIYDILGEFLSERTIEMYAGYIDEGISRSSGVDELQKYFRENLGDDEGEALFKVIRSDFERYRKARPKRSFHPRRRRAKKNTN